MSGDEIQNTGASASQQALIIEEIWKSLTVLKTNSKQPISCIGEDALEVFESLHYTSKDDGKNSEL